MSSKQVGKATLSIGGQVIAEFDECTIEHDVSKYSYCEYEFFRTYGLSLMEDGTIVDQSTSLIKGCYEGYEISDNGQQKSFNFKIKLVNPIDYMIIDTSISNKS